MLTNYNTSISQWRLKNEDLWKGELLAPTDSRNMQRRHEPRFTIIQKYNVHSSLWSCRSLHVEEMKQWILGYYRGRDGTSNQTAYVVRKTHPGTPA
jgi:hypothetical protein